MNLTRYELETIVTFNEAEDFAGVFTHNKSLIRRLEKLHKNARTSAALIDPAMQGKPWTTSSRKGGSVSIHHVQRPR